MELSIAWCNKTHHLLNFSRFMVFIFFFSHSETEIRRRQNKTESFVNQMVQQGNQEIRVNLKTQHLVILATWEAEDGGS